MDSEPWSTMSSVTKLPDALELISTETVDGLQAQVRKVEGELKRTKRNCSSVQLEKDSIEFELQFLRRKVARIEEEREELSKNELLKNKVIENNRETIKQLESDLNEMRQKFFATAKNHMDSTCEIDDLQTSLAEQALEQEVSKLKEQNEMLNKEISQLKNNEQILQSQISDAEVQLAAFNEDSQKTIESLEMNLQTVSNEKRKLMDQCESLTNQIALSRKQFSQESKNRTSLLGQLETVVKQNRDHTNKIKSLMVDNEDLKKKLNESEAKVKRLLANLKDRQ